MILRQEKGFCVLRKFVQHVGRHAFGGSRDAHVVHYDCSRHCSAVSSKSMTI